MKERQPEVTTRLLSISRQGVARVIFAERHVRWSTASLLSLPSWKATAQNTDIYFVSRRKSLPIVVALMMPYGERKNGMKNCTFVSAAKMIRCHALLGLRGIIIERGMCGGIWKGRKTAENPSCFTLCISFLIKSPDIHQFSSAFMVWRLVTMSDDHCERVTGCGRTGTSPKRCDQRLNFQEGRFDRPAWS